MNLNSIAAFSGGYVDSFLTSTLQSQGVISTSNNGADTKSASGQGADSSQLSPFAQILSTLQQLQQSNPVQYQQVTQTIATNLKTASQAAQSQGNTKEATSLNQLASDFSDASSSGNLPSIQDLAKAIPGGHHHYGHGGGGFQLQTLSDLGTTTSTSGDTTTESLNPLSIILNTLNDSGSYQS